MSNINLLINKILKHPAFRIFAVVIPIVIAGVTLFFQFQSRGNIANIMDSTLNQSPILQDSPGTIITYNAGGPIDPGLYSEVINVRNNLTYPSLGGGGNFYNYEVVLPDLSKAFLQTVLFGKNYDIAQCNQAFTECQVYNAYKFSPSDEKDLCWRNVAIATATPAGQNYVVDNIFKATNESLANCFTVVQHYPSSSAIQG
jgi:hypothetical protein